MSELGPRSLLWRYAGDRRYRLTMPRAAALQLLHPAIAAAADQHSRFPHDLWRQVSLAVPRTISVVYDGPRAGRRVRAAHSDIRGHDHLGRRYHSLSPDLFHWEHATFVDALFTMVETFDHRMSPGEREALYGECCTWYRMYGVGDRVLPADHPAFLAYFDRMCRTELQPSPAAEELLDQLTAPRGWVPRTLPAPVVRCLLPQPVRDLLGVEPSPADAARFAAYRRTVRSVYRALPAERRLTRRARDAYAAAG